MTELSRDYMTLCPHCETYLPSRTFRRHRDIFFNKSSGIWQKDSSLANSSGDEILFMELDEPSDDPCLSGHFLSNS